MNLNIGSGDWHLPGWETIDILPSATHQIDLSKDYNLPYDDESIDNVYCAHLLEHLGDERGQYLVCEIYRIMKSGGIVRLVVPSMEKIYAAYLIKNEEFFRLWSSIRKASYESMLVNTVVSFRCKNYGGVEDYGGGPMVTDDEVRDALDVCGGFNSDFISHFVGLIPDHADRIDHINGYDYFGLESMLTFANFRGIYPSSHEQSLYKPMRDLRYFDNYRHMALFVECVK